MKFLCNLISVEYVLYICNVHAVSISQHFTFGFTYLFIYFDLQNVASLRVYTKRQLLCTHRVFISAAHKTHMCAHLTCCIAQFRLEKRFEALAVRLKKLLQKHTCCKMLARARDYHGNEFIDTCRI